MIFLPVSEYVYRIGGTAVGIALAAVTAVWEAVLTPLYAVIGGHVIRLPVAPVMAIVVNVGIVWFTIRVTGKVGPALLPGLAWILVMFAAGDLTSDGDLIVEGTWVGLSTIFLGALAWAGGAYIAINRMRAAQASAPAITTATGRTQPTVSRGPKSASSTPGAGPSARSGAGSSTESGAGSPSRRPAPPRKRSKR